MTSGVSISSHQPTIGRQEVARMHGADMAAQNKDRETPLTSIVVSVISSATRGKSRNRLHAYRAWRRHHSPEQERGDSTTSGVETRTTRSRLHDYPASWRGGWRSDGETPLHEGRSEVASILTICGADVMAQDKNGSITCITPRIVDSSALVQDSAVEICRSCSHSSQVWR
jgi:hypothetical protein